MFHIIILFFIGSEANVLLRNGSGQFNISDSSINQTNNETLSGGAKESGIETGLVENNSTLAPSLQSKMIGEKNDEISPPPLYWMDLISRINKNGTDIIRTKKMTYDDLYGTSILALYNESKNSFMHEEESIGFIIYRIVCLILLVMLLLSAILYHINRIFSVKIELFPNSSRAGNINKKKTSEEGKRVTFKAEPTIIVPLNEYPANQPNNDSEQGHQ